MEPLNEKVLHVLETVVAPLGFHNIAVKTDKGSFKGDNYLGIITKAHVTDGADATKSLDLIVKTATEAVDFRKFVPITEAFERELYFYKKVVPIYQAFLKEYNREPLDLFPVFLGGEYNQVPEVVIMDDMKAKGYVMKSRLEALNIDHVRMVMKNYGHLHGLYYALKAKKPEVAKELMETMPENFFSNLVSQEMTQASFTKYNERVLNALKPEDTEAMEKFNEYDKTVRSNFNSLFDLGSSAKYAVINHGDSWVNNMLFKYNGKDQTTPNKVCLLDFQLARFGSPAFDLSYFLLTCTDKKLRDAHYIEVLHLYHDSMKELLSWFSLDVDDFLPFDALEDQMRKFSRFGLCMTIVVMHLMLSDQDEIPDFESIKLEDVNLEEMGEKFMYKSKNEEKYQERMRGVLLDCVKYGLL